MPTDFEELKRQLLQTDEEFRQLVNQHHVLDEQIHHLTVRQHLSAPEQLDSWCCSPSCCTHQVCVMSGGSSGRYGFRGS